MKTHQVRESWQIAENAVAAQQGRDPRPVAPPISKIPLPRSATCAK